MIRTFVVQKPFFDKDKREWAEGKEISFIPEDQQLEETLLQGGYVTVKIPLQERPDFFETLCKEAAKKVVGEEKTIRTLMLIAVGGRLVENCEASSFNFALNDESGLGKDYVAKNVFSLLPQPDYIYRSRISPTALTYMHNAKFEPEWTWNRKLLYLEDISENILNCEVVKTFMTGGSCATVVIRQRAVDVEITGKPVIVLTFANSGMKNETLRRVQLIKMDGSEEQTRRIKEFRKKVAQKGKTPEYDDKIKNAIAELQRIKVVIPQEITNALDYFPNAKIVRTGAGRFFDLIRASTAIYQFQREKNEEGYYIATRQDYELAREIFLSLIDSKNMTPITKNQRRLLDVIKEMGNDSNNKKFSAPEIMNRVTFLSKPSLYSNLDELSDMGYLKKEVETRNTGSEHFERMTEVSVYSLKRQEDMILPDAKKLEVVKDA